MLKRLTMLFVICAIALTTYLPRTASAQNASENSTPSSETKTLTADELRAYLNHKCGEARARAAQYQTCDDLLFDRTAELGTCRTTRDGCFGALEVYEGVDDDRIKLTRDNAQLEQARTEDQFWSIAASVAAVFTGAAGMASAVCAASEKCSVEAAAALGGASVLSAVGSAVILVWRF